MNSVDLFGFQRILANPAVNFVYLKGEKPCRDSVVKAIRDHHTIAACGFDEADVTLNGHLPGDVIKRTEAGDAVVHVSAKISEGVIREVRVYSGTKVIAKVNPGTQEIDLDLKLSNPFLDKYIRVEAEGQEPERIMVSTPFFLD